ncbi:hypothetical protein J9303_09865 [Bacillaceae bacterium Marseille-Q3522]|nr:hypothetical protein [Bacillaceae bacterium Marseille-Q3522]
MNNKEIETLLIEKNLKKEETPIFNAPDHKILATGEMFRGPSTGITSDIDLDNPGRKLPEKDVSLD